ncbi:hypothetical protein HW555_010360 [Spodoptera exigua]|uniref:Uncharacterized protein n=1 Tax=Spodoptera exigua TaxID=7107 RepID=A0A835GBC4_SPOEX|nr:hypothetical protein HW555_010360 [Spodoptera exigua]
MMAFNSPSILRGKDTNPKNLYYKLDDEIQKLLYPFDVTLLLLLSPRYTIKDDYITTIGKKRTAVQCLSLFFIIIITISSTLSFITDLMVHKYPIVNVALFLWVAKDILLFITQSVECEKFYIANEEAMLACIQLMKNKNCPSDQLHLYKQVLRINRNFNKMSACGFFHVNAQSTITVIRILVGYICVFLQFAFL